LTRRLPEAKLQSLLATMPSSGLVVDYAAQLANGDFGLYSRAELELRAAASWRAVASLLETAGVDLAVLGNPQALELAVDDLLDMQDTYLQAVAAFQYALNLARPLRTITQMQRKQYEMALVLAQHVQALGPGRLPADFLKTDLDDSFYLSEAWAIVAAGTRGLASLAARPGLVLVR
ncbi:MAG TPA: hypothetical protein VLF67_00580, partial [Candidatus Saccharimonas sp.]|nr:hypothetical protein [Candidatus Saccharimonas sp.]